MIGNLLVLFVLAAHIGSALTIAAVKHHHPHPQPQAPHSHHHPHPHPQPPHSHHHSHPQAPHSHHHPHPHPQPPKPGYPVSKPPHHSHHGHSSCKELKGWWESDSHLTMYLIEDIPKSFVVTFDGFFFKSEEKRVAATIMGAKSKLTPHRDDGTFGFVVSFPAGGTAVWVGQCYHEHGKDVLQTLMLHHSYATSNEYWLATRIASQVWKRMPHPPPWYNAASFKP